MFYKKSTLILTALGTILLGTGLHFLFTLLPNPLTALLAPVSESLWEHVKLVFWPYLLAAWWLNRDRPGGVRPWLTTLPLLCVVLLAGGYGYRVLLGGTALWVNILLYGLVMALGFYLPTRFSRPVSGAVWWVTTAVVILLGLLIAYFTLCPPDGILFQDLEPVRTAIIC